MCFFPIQWHCLLISIWKENSTSSNLFVRVLWLGLPPNLVLSFQFYLMIGKQNECSNKRVQTGFLHRWVVTSSADTDLGNCDSIPLSTETIRHGQDLLQQSNPSYCFFYRYSFAHLWLTVVSLVFYIGDSNLMPAYTIMTHGQSNQYPSLQFHSSLSLSHWVTWTYFCYIAFFMWTWSSSVRPYLVCFPSLPSILHLTI